MEIIEFQRNGYTISTDKGRLDLVRIHEYLSTKSYWALGRSFEDVQVSIEHSLCYGVYQGDLQVGFARLVTDFTTFAWLCDVFILEEFRGIGLGKWLMSTVMAAPSFDRVVFILATRDAHELYRSYAGFVDLPKPEGFMVRRGGTP